MTRPPSVLVALGKTAAYLALFLGSQILVTTIWTAAVTADMALSAGPEGPDLEAVYQRVLDATAALTLVSGLLTLAVVLLVYLIRRKPLGEALWLRPAPAPVLLSGAAAAPALYVVIALFLAVLPEAWTADYSQASAALDDVGLVAVLSTVLVAPVAEEVVFRGLIMTRLGRALPGWAAVVLSAAIFGACHGEFLWFCYAFLLGLVFGFLDLRAGSVLPSILGHIAFNGVGQVFTTLNALFPQGSWEAVAVTVLMAAGLLFLLLDRRAVLGAFRPSEGWYAPIDRVAPSPPPARETFAGESTTTAGREDFETDPWAE